MRRVLALLCAASMIWTAGLLRAHADASIVLSKVNTSGLAGYNPGRWTNTTFVLVIGSDERAGLDGRRGDALHVIGLNAGAGKATILDIPRDTWVDIPGHGQGRINEAYSFGGAQLQAQTVHNLTGAPISYVMETTFAGFTAMIDALGGVDVDVPYLMSDPNSGAAFNPGVVHMTGERALAFSRDRHIPDGDLQRTAHQGQLIVHGLAELRKKGTSATDVLHYLDVLFRNVRTEGISSTDLYRLGSAALQIDPGNVRNYAMPATVGMKGAASVVFVKQPAASSLFVDFADDGILQAH
ncbi:MAG: polyisoprenyl-teichoic acid--peptidoglycan teichoic acid transferase [Actinomycetota bacterium]|jgi:LCP family protein required for cell wall assembly|nr:polyisoprenyl-teichoic acid--peptidoglycan teichoic acid transferase [Actinomycetota bacterium]